MVRVTKPGGRVLVHAYGDPHRVDFLAQAVQAVRPNCDGPPSDPPPPEFQLADPEPFGAVLAEAGLHEVQVETVMERTEFVTGETLWDCIASRNPIAEQILGMLELTADERAKVRGVQDTLVRERAAGGDVATLSNAVHRHRNEGVDRHLARPRDVVIPGVP